MFEQIEKLRQEYTDKFVVVDATRPELARFSGFTGVVKTVNMSGRALVEFDAWANIGWYDIDPSFLKVVPKPEPKPEAEKKHDAAAKKAAPAAKAETAAAKPATKQSTADILAAARAKAAAAPAASAPAAGAKKPSTADILAAARAKKGEPAVSAAATVPAADKPAAKAAPPAADPGKKLSTADILAAARAKKAASEAPRKRRRPKSSPKSRRPKPPQKRQLPHRSKHRQRRNLPAARCPPPRPKKSPGAKNTTRSDRDRQSWKCSAAGFAWGTIRDLVRRITDGLVSCSAMQSDVAWNCSIARAIVDIPACAKRGDFESASAGSAQPGKLTSPTAFGSPPADCRQSTTELANAAGTHLRLRQPLATLCPGLSLDRPAGSAALDAAQRIPNCRAGRAFGERSVVFGPGDLRLFRFDDFSGRARLERRGPVVARPAPRADLCRRAPMLSTFWQIAAPMRVLVTFNGKSFDWPMVKDRSTLHRLSRTTQDGTDRLPTTNAATGDTAPAARPDDELARDLLHCDLLHHARRRWRGRLPDCRLQTLERLICRRHRSGDVAGAQVPRTYHDYVRSGERRSDRTGAAPQCARSGHARANRPGTGAAGSLSSKFGLQGRRPGTFAGLKSGLSERGISDSAIRKVSPNARRRGPLAAIAQR